MPIDADEFDRWMRVLQADIAGVNSRLDKLNGTVSDHKAQIAVLEDRGHPAVWGGGLGAFVAAVAEIGKWFFTK